MHVLLQNDYFLIALISISALLVRRSEIAAAVIYTAFCWAALFACYQIPAPEWLISFSDDAEMTQKGWEILIGAFCSLMVIAIVYELRLCLDGWLQKFIIYLSVAEILLHITCYGLLLNGMSFLTYNWIILAHQIAIILLFAARGGYGRTILRSRLFRDSLHSL